VRIPKSIRVAPDGPLTSEREELPGPERLVVAHVTDPDARAMARVAKQLRQRGYRKIRILDGGLEAWVAVGLPTESNESVDPTVPSASH
jgi:3-mercaptopyruvate sulfurtransferase SseA